MRAFIEASGGPDGGMIVLLQAGVLLLAVLLGVRGVLGRGQRAGDPRCG